MYHCVQIANTLPCVCLSFTVLHRCYKGSHVNFTQHLHQFIYVPVYFNTLRDHAVEGPMGVWISWEIQVIFCVLHSLPWLKNTRWGRESSYGRIIDVFFTFTCLWFCLVSWHAWRKAQDGWRLAVIRMSEYESFAHIEGKMLRWCTDLWMRLIKLYIVKVHEINYR